MAVPSFQLLRSKISELFFTFLYHPSGTPIRSIFNTNLDSNHFLLPPLPPSSSQPISLLNHYKRLLTGIHPASALAPQTIIETAINVSIQSMSDHSTQFKPPMVSYFSQSMRHGPYCDLKGPTWSAPPSLPPWPQLPQFSSLLFLLQPQWPPCCFSDTQGPHLA